MAKSLGLSLGDLLKRGFEPSPDPALNDQLAAKVPIVGFKQHAFRRHDASGVA